MLYLNKPDAEKSSASLPPSSASVSPSGMSKVVKSFIAKRIKTSR
jgi:hypothetical protein